MELTTMDMSPSNRTLATIIGVGTNFIASSWQLSIILGGEICCNLLLIPGLSFGHCYAWIGRTCADGLPFSKLQPLFFFIFLELYKFPHMGFGVHVKLSIMCWNVLE